MRTGKIDRVGAKALGSDAWLDISSEALLSDQRWLEALPLPVGIVAPNREAPWLMAWNAALARLLEAADDGLQSRLRGSMQDALSGTQGRADFIWFEPGPGGRHFHAHIIPTTPGGPLLLTLVDRTAAVETERSLRFQMLHDSLTGLPNRLAFAEAVEAALAEDGGAHRIALIALDLARFSRINESAGALVGDELIITVARRLLAVLPPGTLLARTSGDEFSMLVQLIDGPGDMLHVARGVQWALVAPLRLSDIELRIDVAIGCALSHEGAANAADLMRNTQFALKRGKQSRRIEVYQPEAARLARHRFSLETELRQAIEQDELSLAFQPLVDLDGGALKGFEALARWQHPKRGEVHPAEFITVAEESGLIVPLGRWALDRAVQALADWDAALGVSPDCYVSVNVSPVQLQRDAVAEAVAEALQRHGIAGGRLMLELTESTIIADPEGTAQLLAALKTLSCRLAMDDFGTGCSNLAHLQQLPIDVLKIDRRFVSGILGDRDAIAIVRAILGLAAALGMTTIAEGVESQKVARMLAALGCTTGQGYHFGRPLTFDEALERLRAPS